MNLDMRQALIMLPVHFHEWQNLKNGGREFRESEPIGTSLCQRSSKGAWLLYDNERILFRMITLIGKAFF